MASSRESASLGFAVQAGTPMAARWEDALPSGRLVAGFFSAVFLSGKVSSGGPGVENPRLYRSFKRFR
jgi:hypothetical protein